MKKIIIILLSILAIASIKVAGDNKPDYAKSLKIRVLESKMLELQRQIDSLGSIPILEESAYEAEKKQYQKDSTVFSFKSQLENVFLEIEELNK